MVLVGKLVLDFTNVDLAGETIDVRADIGAGQIEVKLTAASLASQGELQGSVSIWSGITNSLHSTIEGFLDSVDGVLTLRQEGMRDTITDFGEQIDAIDARLEIRRARYLKEFIRMEQLMSEMNSSLNTFNMMIANVPGIGSSGSS